MIQSIFQYRSFIWRRAASDLRDRYAATGMGILWNLLHPITQILIYSLIFSSLMSAHLPNLPGHFGYTVFLCSGFFPWVAFTDCLTRGCTAFVDNANYLKKLPIPEQVFVAQNAVTSLFSLVINFSILVVLAILFGFHPSLHWLLVPIPLVSLLLMGFGFGLFLGTLNVFFRDINEWLRPGLQLVMWTAPIVYAAHALPPWAQLVQRYHPILPALTAIRDLFLYHTYPPLTVWIALGVWPLIAILLGVLCLRALRQEIRDVI
jgi:ABC-type polysaccharide/polyol phosphate export permease